MNADRLRIASRSSTPVLVALAALMLGAALLGDPASAQQSTPSGEASATVETEGEGKVRGQVTDTETGAPLEGVTVTVIWQTAANEPRQKVDVTDANGIFKFASVPAGDCSIQFSKAGYTVATTQNFQVKPGETNQADLAIAALPAGAAPAPAPGGPAGVEEFVIVASPLTEILGASRMNADELINTLNAAELSKFAASDVADALRFVPGVNVVQGQFAVIRGLEDRYNSTLYNGAPLPSPDPDSQSVQLDLFPSDIVSNLVIAKTFAPDSPSNTSGGMTNIITHDYPEEFEIKLSAGGGFNSNAWGKFLDYQNDSPMGNEIKGWDTAESDFGLSIGGRKPLFGHELRGKLIWNQEIDYETAEGFVEGREPKRAEFRRFPRPGRIVESADLSLGLLSLSDGRFDLTESNRTEQETFYFGLGGDLDEAGDHKIDGSIFYTKVNDDLVQLQENGYFPDFDYSKLAALQASGNEVNFSDFDGVATLGSWIRDVRGSPGEAPSRGPLWFSSFAQSQSFQRERDLTAYQLNGDHTISQVPGLHFSWAGNQAETTQSETAFGAQYFYEPTDTATIPTQFPTTPQSLGAGTYYANGGLFFNQNDIKENQDFARLDGDYETSFFDFLTLKFSTGGWYERANRDVASEFLEIPTVGGSTQLAIAGDSPGELGQTILKTLDTSPDGVLEGLRDTTSDGEREIKAWSAGSKTTLWDKVDLLAGFRLENISITSINDPFIGEEALDGSPGIFPTKYLFFDRLDNIDRNEISRPVPPGTIFNDQILGLDVPVDPTTGLVDLVTEGDIRDLVDGEIDQNFFLPSLGFAIRPIEGLSMRGAFSETVARPSFREMGFYVSVEPGTNDLVVGNPQLQLSEVTSYDARVEYSWGGLGDLVAVSVFKKKIDDPIESILVRNPANLEGGGSGALFRTFFNNPSTASLRGVEAEARKSFDFIPFEWAQYFSVGGNYTYIDAEVDRSEAELDRSTAFFGTAPDDREAFSALEPTRRLFGQPEWIANVDLTFDHPDWGTKITLAYFAISNVLDASGSVSIGPDGSILSFVPDRYLDSYGQLDLVMSQTLYVEAIKGDLTLKASVKNLTDSSRGYVYDTNQTLNEISERSYKVGRDFSLSLTYTF